MARDRFIVPSSLARYDVTTPLAPSDVTIGSLRQASVPAELEREGQARLDRARARREEEEKRARAEGNATLAANAVQSLAAGFGDEIAAVAPAAYDAATTDETFGDAYRRTRDDYRRTMAETAARHPGAATAGTVIGALTQGAVLPLPGNRPGAGVLRTAGRAGAIGAGLGGIAGLGYSDAEMTPGAATKESLMQAAGDAAGPAALGGALGFGGSLLAQGAGAARRIYNAGRDQAALSGRLGRRAQEIIESGEIPEVADTAIDDLDLEDALFTEPTTLEAPTANAPTVSKPEEVTIRSLITEPLRTDPQVQRLRAAGITGQPQARAVSRMPGGIPGFAERLDRFGISQVGEGHRVEEGVRRAEAIRDVAVRQRNSVLAAANEDGVLVSGDDVAQTLRDAAARFENSTSPVAAAQSRHLMERAADIEGRAFTISDLENEVKAWTDLARFDRNRGEAVLSPDVQNARTVRAAFVGARDAALDAWNPAQAQRFRNAQSAYQVGVTIAPTDRASRAALQGMNRTFSLTDNMAGGTGATIGAALGTAVAGPPGGIVGGGLGALGGSAANRLFRSYEPSLTAVLNEAPRIAERLALARPMSPQAQNLARLREIFSAGTDRVVSGLPAATGDVVAASGPLRAAAQANAAEEQAAQPAAAHPASIPLDYIPGGEEETPAPVDVQPVAEPAAEQEPRRRGSIPLDYIP